MKTFAYFKFGFTDKFDSVSNWRVRICMRYPFSMDIVTSNRSKNCLPHKPFAVWSHVLKWIRKNRAENGLHRIKSEKIWDSKNWCWKQNCQAAMEKQCQTHWPPNCCHCVRPNSSITRKTIKHTQYLLDLICIIYAISKACLRVNF